MSGLAVSVDFDRPNPGAEAVQRMLAAMPHRSPDGTSVAVAQHAVLGLALRATTARERVEAQPLHDPDSGLWLVADARIDNRDEVARALGLPAAPASDARLLLVGLARLGSGLASRLEGDFAFVAWDERRRVLTASRDGMGLRPLFWRATPGGLLVASEVDALLDGGGAAAVESAAVLDHLLNRKRPIERTFFRGIQRLPPGHVLEASAGGVRDLGHSRPPPMHPGPPPPGTEVSGCRARLRAAVSTRIEADRPIVLALSGGLDSSAIACMAEELHREEPGARAPLVLASAIFKGFPADETPYLEAVLARVRFRCVRWDVSEAGPAVPDALPRAHPLRDPMPGGALRMLEVARAEGSRVLLTGFGGDELLFEGGVLEDLARHGRLVALAWETLRGRPYTATAGYRLLSRALRAAAPTWARRAFRAIRPRPAPVPPPWLGPALRPLEHPRTTPRPGPVPSRVQADLRGLAAGEDVYFAVEVAELAAARSGLQLRLPFLDGALVAWVRSIGWERRRPRGLMKRLLRDAMAGAWPEEQAGRREVALADEYLAWSVARSAPLLAPLVEGGRWAAAGFVDQGQAKRMLASLLSGTGADWRESKRLWDIAALEMWMRAVRVEPEEVHDE